jgi:hypothetical protein
VAIEALSAAARIELEVADEIDPATHAWLAERLERLSDWAYRLRRRPV